MTVGDNQRYSVCSTCHRPTPEGKEYCQYCWTRMSPEGNVSAAQAAEIEKRWQKKHRRKMIMKRVGIPVGSVLLVGLITLGMLSRYSDVFSPIDPAITSDSAAGQWSMFHGDLARSGGAGSNTDLPQGQVAWTFTARAGIHSSPAVADGTVYIGSQDGNLYALDAATGSEKWEFKTGSWVLSSPVVAEGIVYVGSNDGFFYAVDALTGKKMWSFKTFYAVMSSAAVADGIVYFGADDSIVYALDAKTGRRIWSFKTGEQVRAAPVVANGIVYISSGDANLYALGAKDGKFRLHFRANLEAMTPAVSGSTVYFSTFDGYLFAVDGKVRNWPFEYTIKPFWLQLWAMHIAPQPPPLSGLIWGMRLGGVTYSSPAVMNDTVYVGVDNKLDSVDARSHAVMWSFKTGDRVNSAPAVCGNTVYVGSDDGKVYAVDAATGTERWHLQTGDKVTSSPAVVEGILYIGSADGKLYAIK